ncbi:Arginase/deacetylase [Limtongia smithiae]|uniref:Arginase/deacetylase n=1 Tax=Limtongia smithiae TaxID=1125753 RepID=UPI0034CE96C7
MPPPSSSASSLQVGYAYSPEYTRLCSLLPSNIDRAAIVDDLILRLVAVHECCDIIKPSFAQKEELVEYHDEGFVSFLLRDNEELEESASERDDDGRDANSSSSGSGNGNDDLTGYITQRSSEQHQQNLNKRYGLEFDCPPFSDMDKYIQAVAGTTIACARYLATSPSMARSSSPSTEIPMPTKTRRRIAVNWHGGRHHAGKSRCSGFCYVNDIVLGILELRRTYGKIMYIDLDMHHGDGVEAAFSHSRQVLTFSVHRHDRGFFPGTGSTKFAGKGRGQGYAVNVGMRQGLTDASLMRVLDEVAMDAYERFQPDAVVVQCGADGLARDPTKEWNLSWKGLGDAIIKIATKWGHSQPVLLLGGGGYKHTDAARLWCYVLGCLTVGQEMVEKWDLIPEGCTHIEEFAEDGYAFQVDNLRPLNDANLKDNFLDRTISVLKERLRMIEF